MTAATLVPKEILGGEYGPAVEEAFDAMAEAVHVVNLATLVMEEKKDKSAIGLAGAELEKQFIRKDKTGEKVCIAHMALMAMFCQRLKDKFPDDLVYCEEDTELLERDKEFAAKVASFLSEFGIVKDATPESTAALVRHAGSLRAKADDLEEAPKRYWVLVPIDTTEEFLQGKQFCMNLTLVQDGEPVVAFMGCPVSIFDHHSRRAAHTTGVPIFFAAKGQGSFTQLVVTERSGGIYLGKSRLKGKPLPLTVGKKIKRGGNDGLYDALGTIQLKIATGSRLRSDIFTDARTIAKNLGSQYPRFDMIKSSIKYAWLARGETDTVWYMSTGLYDKRGLERLAHHVAGFLIAAESGADVADFNGEPVDWRMPVLKNNRGLLATDPSVLPLKGLMEAMKKATETSEAEYEKRCLRRKEVSMFLGKFFENLGKNAETDEEKAGAKVCLDRGVQMLKDDAEMQKIVEDAQFREKPILGDGPAAEEDPFSAGGDGTLPFSPMAS
mmetsp:Transcript_54605/g.175120  ORF Transcript_54605/g.175120 Transcript_54605/m.175120 type:complete len:497 (+) Transcript_54605:202-1692(+)